LIFEVTEQISTKLGHIFIYDVLFEKFGPNSSGIYHPWVGGGKKPLFGTNVKLSPNISLQQKHDINNRKETYESTGTFLHAA